MDLTEETLVTRSIPPKKKIVNMLEVKNQINIITNRATGQNKSNRKIGDVSHLLNKLGKLVIDPAKYVNHHNAISRKSEKNN